MSYTNREKVYHRGRVVGEVAQFGGRDWRRSAAPGAEQYASRGDAVAAAIAESETASPTPTTPQP